MTDKKDYEDGFLMPVPVWKSFNDYEGFPLKGIPSVSEVANLAVRLKKGRQGWDEAVKEALEALDMASWAIYHLEKEKQRPVRLDPPDSAKFKFAEGIKLITGHKRKDRATVAFQDLVSAIIDMEGWELAIYEGRTDYANQSDCEKNKKELVKVITRFEADGFNGKEIKCYRSAYNAKINSKEEPCPPLTVFVSKIKKLAV
jgi:hypothetical protein